MNYKGKVLFCDVQTTPTLYFRQKKEARLTGYSASLAKNEKEWFPINQPE